MTFEDEKCIKLCRICPHLEKEKGKQYVCLHKGILMGFNVYYGEIPDPQKKIGDWLK